MRQTGIFYINEEKLELPIFQKGDRVRPHVNDSLALGAEGTVIDTREGGLFVDVKWDKSQYDCSVGGSVMLGSGRMVDGLELIEEEA